jgi:hypothetical protein
MCRVLKLPKGVPPVARRLTLALLASVEALPALGLLTGCHDRQDYIVWEDVVSAKQALVDMKENGFGPIAITDEYLRK